MADSGFLAALAGAVVGGGASLAGSVLVNRREHVRAARIRLHDELVPALREELPPKVGFLLDSHFEEVLEATRRAAVLAGRRSVELVDEIDVAHTAWWAAIRREEGPADEYGNPTEPADREGALEEVKRRIDALATWVEKKIL